MSDTALARRLTWVHGTALAIGAVLGSGILILPAVTAQQAGPAALVAWLLMSTLAFPLSLTLGQLGAAYPHAGGIVEYVRVAWGDRIAHITAWLFLGTIPVGVPIIALIGANYATSTFALPNWAIPLIAAGMLFGSLFLHARGVELSGRVQVAVLAMIAAIIIAAIVMAAPSIQAKAFYPWAPHGWAPIGTASVTIFWSFVGWEMVGHLAEEFRDPERDLKRTFLIAPALVGALYMGLALVTVGTHAYGASSTLTPLSQLVAIGFGQSGRLATGALALLITAVAVHGNIAGFSRMVFSQARAGIFPARLARLHPSRKTPTTTLWALAVDFTIVFILYVVLHANLSILIIFPSTVFLVLYSLAMLSAMKMLSRPHKRPSWLATVALVVCIGLMPFSGWALLYPLFFASIGWVMTKGHQPPPQPARPD